MSRLEQPSVHTPFILWSLPADLKPIYPSAYNSHNDDSLVELILGQYNKSTFHLPTNPPAVHNQSPRWQRQPCWRNRAAHTPLCLAVPVQPTWLLIQEHSLSKTRPCWIICLLRMGPNFVPLNWRLWFEGWNWSWISCHIQYWTLTTLIHVKRRINALVQKEKEGNWQRDHE